MNKKERLQKWLAQTGLMSRRKAEEYISSGRIRVNTEVITQMGTLVDPHTDKIYLDNKPLKLINQKTWIALYKPINYITSKKDPEGRKTVMELLKNHPHLYPVGRLDFESEGLLLLTNDGELTFTLTHPKFEISKIYEVSLSHPLKPDIKLQLLSGTPLKDGNGIFKSIKALSNNDHINSKNTSTYLVTVTEGRNRFIRRMFGHFNLKVLKLKRIQIGPISLKNLKPKEFRFLDKNEIKKLTSLLEIKK